MLVNFSLLGKCSKFVSSSGPLSTLTYTIPGLPLRFFGSSSAFTSAHNIFISYFKPSLGHLQPLYISWTRMIISYLSMLHPIIFSRLFSVIFLILSLFPLWNAEFLNRWLGLAGYTGIQLQCNIATVIHCYILISLWFPFSFPSAGFALIVYPGYLYPSTIFRVFFPGTTWRQITWSLNKYFAFFIFILKLTFRHYVKLQMYSLCARIPLCHFCLEYFIKVRIDFFGGKIALACLTLSLTGFSYSFCCVQRLPCCLPPTPLSMVHRRHASLEPTWLLKF